MHNFQTNILQKSKPKKSVSERDLCAFAPVIRKACGDPGISEDACHALDCCYDDTNDIFIKCYYKLGKWSKL